MTGTTELFAVSDSVVLHGDSNMWRMVDMLADALLEKMVTDAEAAAEKSPTARDLKLGEHLLEAREHTGSMWFGLTLRIGSAMLNESELFSYHLEWDALGKRTYSYMKVVEPERMCTQAEVNGVCVICKN